MKKILYLSVLLGTSILATLIKIYNTFFAKLKASSGHSTGNIEIDALLSESRLVLERQHAFTTNGINKLFVMMMSLMLLLALYYLIKKDLKAVYSYLLYLVLTLVHAIYSFFSLSPLAKLYSDDMLGATIQTGEKAKLIFSVVLFLLYLLIVVANNRVKSNVELTSSVGIDV